MHYKDKMIKKKVVGMWVKKLTLYGIISRCIKKVAREILEEPKADCGLKKPQK